MTTQVKPFHPPMLDGVSASKVYLPSQSAYKTVYEYLCQHFSHISPSEWLERFNNQLILSMYGEPLSQQSIYMQGQHIYYYRFLSEEIEVPFQHQILYETEHFIAVDKPHFLTMSPTGQYVQQTLLVRLKKQLKNDELTPIHRLDRETAGVVLFCKNAQARAAYQTLFAQRQVKKIYHAIAAYLPELESPTTVRLHIEKGCPFYIMNVNLNKTPNSETKIQVIARQGQLAKYELFPKTGKQHQLRVHLNFLGIPILNDRFYPVPQHINAHDFTQPLQLLAKSIQFIDPYTHQEIFISSPRELTL